MHTVYRIQIMGLTHMPSGNAFYTSDFTAAYALKEELEKIQGCMVWVDPVTEYEWQNRLQNGF